MKLLAVLPFLGLALAETTKYIGGEVVTTDAWSDYTTAAQDTYKEEIEALVTTAVGTSGALKTPTDVAALLKDNTLAVTVYDFEEEGTGSSSTVKFSFELEAVFTADDDATDANMQVITDWIDGNDWNGVGTLSDVEAGDESESGAGSLVFAGALVAGMLLLRD